MLWRVPTGWKSTPLGLGLIGIVFLAGCKPAATSTAKDSAPDQVADVTTGGPGGANEMGVSVGSADQQFSSSDYLKPNGQPFEWTEDMTQTVLTGLSPVCPGDTAPTDGTATGQVAFVLDGNCQIFSINDAQQEIANLGAMYAVEGTNLVDVMADQAASSDLQAVDAAVPAVDLGAIVNQQDATSLALLGPQSKGLALDDTGGGPGWVGSGKNYTAGSNQFSTIATAYFYVRNRYGLGLHSAVDLTGKAFSIQRSLVYTKLEASALTVGSHARSTSKSASSVSMFIKNLTRTRTLSAPT